MQHSLLPCAGGGPEQLVLFLVTRPGVAADAAALKAVCQAAISGKLNPLFKVGCLRRALISSLCGAHGQSSADEGPIPVRKVFAARRILLGLLPPSAGRVCLVRRCSSPTLTPPRTRPPAGGACRAAALAAAHRHQQSHAATAAGRAARRAARQALSAAAVRAWRSGAGCTLCKT